MQEYEEEVWGRTWHMVKESFSASEGGRAFLPELDEARLPAFVVDAQYIFLSFGDARARGLCHCW